MNHKGINILTMNEEVPYQEWGTSSLGMGMYLTGNVHLHWKWGCAYSGIVTCLIGNKHPYRECTWFGFHIVNFPFMSSNIPSAPAYGVYASQLIRYARCCSNYSDFLIRHRALVKRLLSQGYKVNRLSNTFKKFYGRHTDLVGQYKKNVCQMFADSIS